MQKSQAKFKKRDDEIVSPDALNAYLVTIRDIPVLDREVERKVALRAKKGDKKAWDLLIRSSLRFVVSVAHHYKGCGVGMADLIVEGNIGLIEAAKRFDPERDVRFTTYAYWWIRQTMVRAIASQGGPVPLSVKQVRKRLKVSETAREMGQAAGQEPTIEDLAEAMDEHPKEVTTLRAARQGLSLDAPVGDAGGITHVDLLSDGKENPSEEVVTRMDISSHVIKSLARLPKREAEILRLRYGFSGDPMTLQEIGGRLNLSRERIRQLEQSALNRLREESRLAPLRETVNRG